MDDKALYKTGQQLAGTVYRVVRHLATGGMGSVYDVEDVTVGKRYVLKTLHPQLVSREDLARRMEAEARTLAKLQHPNIVDVVTAGVTTDGTRMPFYVMERLNGQNLRVLLEKRGIIELAHAFRIAIDVLDALEHAHENNVIHRDVKPENIFLHRQINGTTITKLLDFGIMRLLDRKRSHTQGKFIGTLRYASPEQIMGGELGPATDIYSLGLVLYEMIAGRGPFDDVGDAYAIGAAHAQKPAPALSTFTQVPRSVEALVMSALAKDPAERPRDAFTFASELRRMLREHERAPREETAVNVLSSVPATSGPELAFDGTVPAYEPDTDRDAAASGRPGSVPGTATEIGMPLPSALGPPPSGGGVVVTPAPMGGGAVVAVTPAPATASGTGPTMLGGANAGLDREAATHTSVPFGQTMRLASNGTEIDGPESPRVEAPIEVIQAALGRREGLVVPPVTEPRAAPPGDLVFAGGSSQGPARTGPTAGEAPTRPPERSLLAPLAGALAVAVIVIGGAVVLVKGRIAKEQASAPNAPVASASADVLGSSASAEPSASAQVEAREAASDAGGVTGGAREDVPAVASSTAPKPVATPKARAAPTSAPAAPRVTATATPTAAPRAPATTPPKAPTTPKVPGYDD